MASTSEKICPCLWFADQAEQAAQFYVSLLPGSAVVRVQRNSSDSPSGKAGSALMVVFDLAGRRFLALNGGSPAAASHAVSFMIDCADQAEVDALWNAFCDGGQPQRCGWVTDRFGVTWQVVPSALPRLLGDPDPARAKRVMQAMLTMTKIDIAALEAA